MNDSDCRTRSYDNFYHNSIKQLPYKMINTSEAQGWNLLALLCRITSGISIRVSFSDSSNNSGDFPESYNFRTAYEC